MTTRVSRWNTLDRSPWESRLLTREEERTLALALRHGTEAEAREARTTLAACNLPWCRKFSARVAAKFSADPDDCFGAAQLGLLTAIEKFDPDRGCKFITLATWEIVAAIQLRALPYIHAVSTPTYMTKGGKGNLSNMAAAAAWGSCLSLDRGYDGKSISSVVPDGRDDLGDMIEADETRAILSRLAAALRALAPRERDVIRLRFPLDGSAPASQVAVGRELGCSREWVRSIEAAALAKLRAFLEGRRVTVATGDELREVS